MSAVKSAQETGLDSSTKRKMAFDEIVTKAETIGIAVASSMVSLVLEMALQALKNNSGNQGNING